MLWFCLMDKQVLPYSLPVVFLSAFLCVDVRCKLNIAWLILNCIVKIPCVHFRDYKVGTALQQILSYGLPFFFSFFFNFFNF